MGFYTINREDKDGKKEEVGDGTVVGLTPRFWFDSELHYTRDVRIGMVQVTPQFDLSTKPNQGNTRTLFHIEGMHLP